MEVRFVKDSHELSTGRKDRFSTTDKRDEEAGTSDSLIRDRR
jgi:hypothetical protein